MDIEEMVKETFRNYHMSAVLILQRTTEKVTSGTGFVIGKGESFYLVMTCRHCVNLVGQNGTLSARFSGKTIEYECEKLYDSIVADIAIIKVNCVPESEDCPILKFGDSEGIAPKADIVQLGYIYASVTRLSLNPSPSPGIFVALHENGSQGAEDVIYVAAGKSGSSGSPVLLNFNVIGMLYAVSMTDQSMFAVSSKTIRNIMKSWLQLPAEDGSTIEQMINVILTKI